MLDERTRGLSRRARLLIGAFATLVACVCGLVVGDGPTQAAFPDTNGKIAFSALSDWEDFDVFVVNSDGSGLTNLTSDWSADVAPVFSPDGSRIAFMSDRAGNEEIYLMNADGTDLSRVTNNTARDFGPAFSADGSKIAFTSDRDGNRDIYVVNIDGSGETRLMTNAANEEDPTFSADGASIAFTSDRDGNREIYIAAADGANPVRLTADPAADYKADFSPDGARIAFTSERDGGVAHIYVMRADGSAPTMLTSSKTSSDHGPSFSADGKMIAFAGNFYCPPGLICGDLLSGAVYVTRSDGSGGRTAVTGGSIVADPDWGIWAGSLAEKSSAGSFAAAGGAATEPATLIVDRDGVQCANADFTSIQAAVDAAQPGDLVRVCPDLYAETVVVDKPLTLKGDPDAVEAVDCFQPTLPELPPDQQAIVDPAGEGFSIAFKLEADDVVLEGFVVQGATVGVDASDRFSGYRIHHNLIRLNTLFGVDFGSEGTHESRTDHNCIRENEYGLVSELDDDSLWKPSDGPERDEWNARDLRNARLDHNDTTENIEGIATAGPGKRIGVTIDHNRSRGDLVGVGFQNSTGSAIVDNEVTEAGSNAIVIGGGNEGLVIGDNLVQDAGSRGVLFVETFIDRFPIPSRNVVVARNNVTRSLAGIFLNTNNLAQSWILENTTSENRGNGINVLGGNTENEFRGNRADNNRITGINVVAGATANRFVQNSMYGNAVFDARDANRPANTWIANQCLTDSPTGTICGFG
jgi:WD40-like Beta Propeller Repeat